MLHRVPEELSQRLAVLDEGTVLLDEVKLCSVSSPVAPWVLQVEHLRVRVSLARLNSDRLTGILVCMSNFTNKTLPC